MRAWLSCLATLGACAAAPAPIPAPKQNALYSADALDHLLLWTSDVDRATSALTVNLGFHVRPGGSFPDGVANRIVRFADDSYLELLYFTRPEGELSGEALEEYRFTRSSGGGANSFAFAIEDADATRAHLIARGFRLDDAHPPARPERERAALRRGTRGDHPVAA